MPDKKILIIGSFFHPKNPAHSTSAAEQLAALFNKRNIPVITATRQYKKLHKLVATIYAIVAYRKQYTLAVIPLYGTPMSFIWQQISSSVLRVFKKKIVLVVHGGSIPMQIKNGNGQKFLNALNFANVVVCPSAYMQIFLKDYGVQSVIIENALDINSYKHIIKKAFRPHIFWMRAFEDVYNPEMALRVGALLSKKYPSFKMIMAGHDQGKFTQILKMIKDLNLESKIDLPGFLTHQEKLNIAGEFDFFICTNRIDNAPVSIVENMAMGLAIVSVNTGGIPYIIQRDKNGLLVNLDDDETMVSKIEEIIKDPQLGIRLCENGYASAWQYDEEIVFKKWQSVFLSLN